MPDLLNYTSGLSEFPKYTRHTIFCTEEAKFKDVDIGNLFFIGGDMYIRINIPPKRQFSRNAVIVLSKDPGLCGIGIWLEGKEDVEIVTESTITLKGDSLM